MEGNHILLVPPNSVFLQYLDMSESSVILVLLYEMFQVGNFS